MTGGCRFQWQRGFLKRAAGLAGSSTALSSDFGGKWGISLSPSPSVRPGADLWPWRRFPGWWCAMASRTGYRLSVRNVFNTYYKALIRIGPYLLEFPPVIDDLHRRGEWAMNEVDISIVAKLFVQTEMAITAKSICDATDRITGNMERGVITLLQGDAPITSTEEAARLFSVWVQKEMTEIGLAP
ncbi:hypothetical protein JKG47_15015 [Acidithiobacillus sp. MC6.1]|nr:hypothetical protein [Acidithiobacillus sp. MC6.1]